MTDDADTLVAIEEVLQHLEAVSFVAHRDAKAALPSLEPFGSGEQLHWLEGARELFFHDRDAGKAFMRHTAETVEKSGTVRAWVDQARSFTQWRGSWKALEAFMEQVGDVWRDWGGEGERAWYELGHTWLGRHLDSGVAYFRTPYRELAGGAGIAGVEALLAPAEALFQERRLALGSYIGGALRVRRLAGDEGLEQWARRGADILQAGRQRGEAYFRLESDESLSLLLEGLPGLRLREHARLFQLLAYAWFGEELLLEDSGWSPDQGRAFIETDGRRLFLPVVLTDRDEAMLALNHAGGHLRFDSYERANIEALFAEVGMAHPPLDEDQRITWRPLFARYGEDMIRFQLLFDLCEDLRVDAAVDRIVPGHLSRLYRKACAAPVPQGAAGAYFEAARDSVARALGQDAPGLAAMDERLRPLLAPEATIVDAFRIADALYERRDADGWPAIGLEERDAAFLPGRAPNAARPVYPRARLESAEDPDFAYGVEGAQEEHPKPDEQRVPQDAGGNDPDFDIPPEDTAGAGGRVGVGIPQPARVYGRGRGHRHDARGVPYREWDYRENAFKLDWAWVQERPLAERDPALAERIVVEQAGVLKRLRKALQMQRPNRPAPLRRQMDGDELDLEATIEYVTERRAGRSPTAHVYRRRAVQHRETAVTLLADLSTSIMAEAKVATGRDAGQPAGKVVDRLRAGMMLFAEALEQVGDQCAIAGFASKYRDNVSYYPIKHFDEPLSADVRATIAAVSGRLATRMGAAIRHALSGFKDTSAGRRLLLILSDGRPADYDDGGDARYLHEDTRMAVKEALDAGVHPFCITLDPAGSEYLPAIFGPGHYLVLDNVDDLPRRLPEVYLRLRH